MVKAQIYFSNCKLEEKVGLVNQQVKEIQNLSLLKMTNVVAQVPLQM